MPKSNTVRNKQTVRVRIDGDGTCRVVVCGVLTLEAVPCDGYAQRIRTKRELGRIKGLLAASFTVPVRFSVSESWERALPEGGEQNGGVSDE